MTEQEAIQARDPFALATSRGLRFYVGTPAEDIAILAWQRKMLEDGEFFTIFTDVRQAPSSFLDLFRPPNLLFYKLNADDAIHYAAWFTPSWFGAFGSVWVARSIRGTHVGEESFLLGQCIMAIGFKLYPLLGGITSRTPFVAKNADKWYVNMGKLPYKLNGEHDQWLLFYTKEQFENGPFNPFQSGQET